MTKKFISFSAIILFILSIPFLASSCTIDNSKKLSQNSVLKVHFIDVGQGDSILITINNKSLLIDSGPKENRYKLLNFLKSQNIKTIDYAIATHPHEDHIGNMDKIISDFNLKSFYAPKVTHTSKSFEKMIEALLDKNLKINIIKPGILNLNLDDNITIEVLSPNKSFYDNLNNYSPIIKLSYKNTSFMFTGDAEKEVEEEVLKSNSILESNVLKLGHHGSKTSTTEEFLHAVNPSIAIISCGKDNKYNHPSSQVKSLLKKYNTSVYRTDLDGDIIIHSNGDEIKIYTSKF